MDDTGDITLDQRYADADVWCEWAFSAHFPLVSMGRLHRRGPENDGRLACPRRSEREANPIGRDVVLMNFLGTSNKNQFP